MSYSDEAIALQLQLGEDSRWEFKQIEFAGSRPRGPSREDLADEIAAFANANGGVLLCSVTDAGEVRGMSREQLVELDALLVEVSSDSIRPSVRIRTYHQATPGWQAVTSSRCPGGRCAAWQPRRELCSGRRLKTKDDE